MRKLRRVIDSHYNRSNDDSSTCPQIWDDLRREFSIPIESSISTLFTNEWLIFSVVRYLMDLPFTINARKIISTMV